VHAQRVEDVDIQQGDIDAVSARALADLPLLLELSSPWLNQRSATGWFHKGRDYRRELEAARFRWAFDLVEHRSKINAESVILQISNLRAADLG
jgi:16S rRNA (guanine527-N7)-methyltransferase